MTSSDISANNTAISSIERRILWTITALLVALLTLPYLWAWFVTPGDGVYSGLLYNPDDQNVHLAWARQAHDGQGFIRDMLTNEWLQNGEPALFTNLLTTFIGLVSRLTTLPLVVVYHAVRVLGAVATLWFFAALCAQLTNDKRVRMLAVSLVAFGGGIGGLQSVFPHRTFVDNATAPLTMPEAWTFHSAFVFPLFIVPIALLALIYGQTLRARDCGHWKHAIYAGIAALLLANIHTYDVVPLNIVMILWALWSFLSSTRSARQSSGAAIHNINRMRWLAPLIVVAFTIPQVAYQFFVLRNSEEFRVKALSPKIAPPFLDIAFSYAPYLILSIFAVWILWRTRQHKPNIEYSMSQDLMSQDLMSESSRVRHSERSEESGSNQILHCVRNDELPDAHADAISSTRQSARIMVLWIVTTLILIYTPISFARKMIEGVHLPLCFLASFGFIALLDRFRLARRKQPILAGVFALLMSVSSLQFAFWCLENAVDNNSTGKRANAFMPPLYILQETQSALNYLNTLQAPRTRVVLCFPRTGNYVPRESGWPVYVGHFDETLYAARKLDEVVRFYDGRMNDADAAKWLRENRIGFILVGPLERSQLNRVLDLPVAWQQGETTIYRVPD